MTQITTVPTIDDIRDAADVLDGVAHRTPVITSTTLNNHLSTQLNNQRGVEVYLKAENLQRVGAFKFRGAYHALHHLPESDPVVAYSAGNHAQAIALAARLQHREATIVMPSDSPQAKLNATAGYGADVVTYDRYTEDRMALAEQLAQQRGAHIIPPYDHPHVAAGQGTAALEMFEQVAEMAELTGDHASETILDLLFVPVGGGGLLAGTLLAAQAAGERAQGCAVYGVEPETGDDVRVSLERGERVEIDVPQTIADGVQTTLVGALTFPVIQRLAAGITTVSDAQLLGEMRFLAERMKTVVEPTGCLGLAGARKELHLLRSQSGQAGQSGQAATAGEAGWVEPGERPLRVGVVLSGGNVDLARFADLVG